MPSIWGLLYSSFGRRSSPLLYPADSHGCTRIFHGLLKGNSESVFIRVSAEKKFSLLPGSRQFHHCRAQWRTVAHSHRSAD